MATNFATVARRWQSKGRGRVAAWRKLLASAFKLLRFAHRLGGSLDSPPEFAKEEGTTPRYVGLRALDRLRMRLDPMLRATCGGASCVVGIAPDVETLLEGISLKRFEAMTDGGIESLPAPMDRAKRTGQVRLLFVGRLVRTKGARDAIRAMKLLADLPVVLGFVGEGYDQEACRSLVSEIGVSERVIFHGRQPRYRAADIFVFPSYREAGGLVVMEATGTGSPPSCGRQGNRNDHVRIRLCQCQLKNVFRAFWDLLSDKYSLSIIAPGGRRIAIDKYSEDFEYFRGSSNYLAVLR